MTKENEVKTIEEKYEKAERLKKSIRCLTQNKGKADMYKDLAKQYKSFGDYKDSLENYQDCIKQQKKYEILAKEDKEKEIKAVSEDESLTVPKKGKRVFVFALVILALIFCIGGAVYLKTESGRYLRADYYEKSGNYIKSYKMFNNLKNYRDSTERTAEAHYKYIKQCIKEDDHDTAISELRKTADYRDCGELLTNEEISKIKKSDIGADVLFGEAHWIILEKEDNKAMLGKLKPIQVEGEAYNKVSSDITWEKCSLRKYLNAQFADEIFNTAMLEKIQLTDIFVADNKQYNTIGGRKTCDKLFLLNDVQAEKYSGMLNGYLQDWWLINPGAHQNMAQFVSDGKVMESGYDVSSDNIFIRPAMWVSLENE